MAAIDVAARSLSCDERSMLKRMMAKLRDIGQQGGDPKYKIVRHYLIEEGWLELGSIVFSQYFDTAAWIAARLAEGLPDEPVALYAGAGKSRILVGELGRASCRERGCPYVWNPVVALSLKKKI